MRRVQVKFIKTHPDAILPTRNHGNRPISEQELNQITESMEDYYQEFALKSGRSISDVKLNIQAQQNYFDEKTKEVFNTCDSGYDIYCCEDVTIPARGNSEVETGIKLGYIDPGFWIRIEGRSGLGFKHSLFPHFGIIDNSYRGRMSIKVYNNSDTEYVVKKGDRIAQLVVYPVIDYVVDWTEEVQETPRGENNLGSSGK